MFQKFHIRIYRNIDDRISDSEDIKVFNSDNYSYILGDTYGNKIIIKQENGDLASLIASGSSYPGFCLCYLIKKRHTDIRSTEIHIFLVEELMIKEYKNLIHVMNTNYKPPSETFINFYENIVFWSPWDKDYLFNTLISINQSIKLQEGKSMIPAKSEILLTLISPN